MDNTRALLTCPFDGINRIVLFRGEGKQQVKNIRVFCPAWETWDPKVTVPGLRVQVLELGCRLVNINFV